MYISSTSSALHHPTARRRHGRRGSVISGPDHRAAGQKLETHPAPSSPPTRPYFAGEENCCAGEYGFVFLRPGLPESLWGSSFMVYLLYLVLARASYICLYSIFIYFVYVYVCVQPSGSVLFAMFVCSLLGPVACRGFMDRASPWCCGASWKAKERRFSQEA